MDSTASSKTGYAPATTGLINFSNVVQYSVCSQSVIPLGFKWKATRDPDKNRRRYSGQTIGQPARQPASQPASQPCLWIPQQSRRRVTPQQPQKSLVVQRLFNTFHWSQALMWLSFKWKANKDRDKSRRRYSGQPANYLASQLASHGYGSHSYLEEWLQRSNHKKQ